MSSERENFGSRFAVIMTLAGSAIGLGNIWRFPYMVGEYGGAAFILIYIAATIVLSLPIFFAESLIGRRSGSNCLGAMRKLSGGKFWKLFGYLSVITPIIIVSYYSVVGGWSFDFLVHSLALDFTNLPETQISGMFESLTSSPYRSVCCFTIFFVIAALIVAGGVKKGIEKFSKICLPLLFVLVVVIAVFAVMMPGSKEGVEYLLKPDFSKITLRSCAYAMGQSFYSLSLGMGIIITYSSYVSKEENLLASGTGTAVSDLLFAMIAGMAIMPAVFASGIEPSSGPGLVFNTLPHVFHKMGDVAPWLGATAAILFFLAIFFAALTSAISLIEVGVAYLVEEHHLSRIKATIAVTVFAWLLGLGSCLSFGPLAGVKIFGLDVFSFFDTLSSNFLLTLGGLLCVLFVGWSMKKEAVRDEFTNGGTLKLNGKFFGLLYFLMKYVAPVAVTLIFITNFIL